MGRRHKEESNLTVMSPAEPGTGEVRESTLGPSTLLFVPFQAVSNGASGRALFYVIVYVVVGLPTSYIEYVVGQFTGRDCIEVWKARDCLSHIGYVYIIWQIYYLMYCQALCSFVLHYFLITFEKAIPYHSCGYWSTPDCNILNRNYSINQECFKSAEPRQYCFEIYKTFSEYQYWRYHILGIDESNLHFAWRVCLASSIISVFVYLTCFRGLRSWRWVLAFVVLYPTFGRFLFLIGSLLQKGIAAKFMQTLDCEFELFIERFDLANSATDVIYNLGVGSGLGFNLSSKAPFRSPCYANTVIMIFINCNVLLLGIFSTAMMICPYSYRYNVEPIAFMFYEISNIFEKLPKLLTEYSRKSIWLLISFSYITVATLSLITLFSMSLIEMMSRRYKKVNEHPGLVAFMFSVTLFVSTAPFLCNHMFYVMVEIMYSMYTLMVFLIVVQNIVFVMWYGIDKFTEDIHFMLGIQPKLYFKISTIISTLTLIYVCFVRLCNMYMPERRSDHTTVVGFWLVMITILMLGLITVVKLMRAARRKEFHLAVRLDPTWGPRSDVMKRSRTLFTAQAMTKEYIYRQYHLQAGIIKRQKASNIRVPVVVPLRT